MAEGVFCGLGWLTSHAADLGDPGGIAVMGDSGGGGPLPMNVTWVTIPRNSLRGVSSVVFSHGPSTWAGHHAAMTDGRV
jgi:NADPH:quinone reductase-like Zn-dependent oxidoreductase